MIAIILTKIGRLHLHTAIRTNLEKQLVSSVRWTETIQSMVEGGIETFVEIGSKNVLTGLLRRIDRSKTGISIQDLKTLQEVVNPSA